MTRGEQEARPGTVMITGAAGFIGSRLVERLAGEGRRVVALDCLLEHPYPAAGKEVRLKALGLLPGVEAHRVDMADSGLADLLPGVDAVVNLAAMTGLDPGASAADYRQANVEATGSLIEACLGAGVVRLVHASTSSVYGAVADGDESAPLEPISDYGQTKLEGEQLVLGATRERRLPATVLRYFSVFGPGQRPDMGYRRLIDSVLSGREFTVFGDGTQTRSSTYVDDVVDATLKALFAPAGTVVGEVFNVAGGESVSLNEAIGIVEELTGRKARIIRADPRPGDQESTAGDWSKARDLLGYSPSVSFRDGIARQIEWQRSLGSGKADREGAA